MPASRFSRSCRAGYWDLFDPTNGYTAIHAALVRELPLDKLSRRYFFESDILFRLNVLRRGDRSPDGRLLCR